MIDLFHPLMIIPGTLISEDLTFFTSLLMYQQGSLGALPFIALFSVGALIGDIGLYLIGFLIGRYENLKWVTWLKGKYAEKASGVNVVDHVLVFTRCIPGSRIPTYVACGMAGYSLRRFSAILFLSAIIYTGVGLFVLSSVSQVSGNELTLSQQALLALSSVLVTTGIFKLGVGLKRGYSLKRRLQLVKIKLTRMKHLEFWPGFLLYLPIVPHFIYLLIKHRGFTALYTNPGIHMAGLIGEKKSDIDQVMMGAVSSNRLELIKIENPVSIDVQRLTRQVEFSGLSYPVVVKPDSGLRGAGVQKAESMEDLIEDLSTRHEPVVIQELSRYKKEIGFYFYRDPKTNEGKVFSVNEKLFPTVIGDGKGTLLDLVLDDELLSLRYDIIFRENKISEDYIPGVNEEVQLVFRGSHSKGSIFLEGEGVLSEQAKGKVLEVVSRIDGFDFGRLDVRFDSSEGVERGEFDIIEINGAGAESTNLYDPRKSKLEVYQILIRQWSLAFRIGERNVKNLTNGYGEVRLSTFLRGLMF
jgi:membrane protein DedA with SNARE-associated domain